ncbi:MAG: 50S ribosomal protein P1 [Candidatus Aenigmarchaeota archaeon]|nr:50S ribosomal protein P1 [Candidatus Aenigmarchaeota archaeon]
MNYIYSALLLHSAGKPVSEDSVKKVVQAAGEQPDEAKVKALVAALDGVNIDEVISKAAMPVAVAAAPAGGAAVAVAAEAAEKKDEEDMEKKAEEAASGLASLFG